MSCKQRLTARGPRTLLVNPTCSGPGRRSPTDQVGLTATLLQYMGFTCYQRLPSPQCSNRKHQAESCPSCHSSKAQNPGGCSTHSRSCGGEKPQLTLPQSGTGMLLGAQSFCRKDLNQLPFRHAYQGRPWLCPILGHPGEKSQGLCWRHGRHHPEEDAQHSFYPLQSNMKVLGEQIYKP